MKYFIISTLVPTIVILTSNPVTSCQPCVSSCTVDQDPDPYDATALGLNNDGSVCVPGGSIPAK